MKQQHTLDNDDAQVGRILSRREVLALLGGSSAALLAACAPGALTSASPTATNQQTSSAAATAAAASSATAATVLPSCIVRPALTEGPYFVDEKLSRSDIRSDPGTGAVRPGALLTLNFLVSRVSGSACTALSGAVVDVWHCDASGVYSGVQGVGGDFLRGFQRTDANGSAAFTTIYPGWYPGRAVHVHFKLRLFAGSTKTYEFTSQFFFDEALTDAVYAQSPYAARGRRNTLNSNDGIYNGLSSSEKAALTLTPKAEGGAYAGVVTLGVRVS